GETGKLALVSRHDQLAAPLVWQPALGDVTVESLLALRAEPGLERTRRVVDAGVDDSRVVAGLVGCDLRLLVERDEAEAGALLEQAARGCEPENARTHDHDVIRLRPVHAASLYDRPA